MTRIAVLGGVYANPFALRAVLDDARRRGCVERYCLGDLGGFGAACDEVWPLLLEGEVRCIAGNYDIAIGRGDPDCGCGYESARDNEFAQIMYDHTRAHTSRAFAAWMAQLPRELRLRRDDRDLHLVHGSPLEVNDFLWGSLTDDELRLRLDACTDGRPDVLLCTHTGLAWQRRVDETLIVNVGAAGRPANDGRREVGYAVVDVDGDGVRAELVSVPYDWRSQVASMRAAQLPEAFIETVATGWWTTCLEIVPPRERAAGRYHVYRESLPAAGFGQADGVGWADAPSVLDDGRPVVSLFPSGLFPPRLWIYTNFHCNLSCAYCVVASSPQARRRQLTVERVTDLVDEAAAEGFTEIYLTGGEPFVHPDIIDIIEASCDRLPTVVLTNAMLFTGRRLAGLERLAGRENLVLQSSLDGADAATHDAWRGAGSWRRALDGLTRARRLGLPVRVAMTETPDNRLDVQRLRELLEDIGVHGSDFAVRPLISRGLAAGEPGMEVSDAVLVPELTVTADGVHWHPVGADSASSADFLLAGGEPSLAHAKRLVIERFLALRQADGTLPEAFHCAI